MGKSKENVEKEWERLYKFLLSQPDEIKANKLFRDILIDLKRLKLNYGELVRYYGVLLNRTNNVQAHPSIEWKIKYLEGIKSQVEQLGIIREK